MYRCADTFQRPRRRLPSQMEEKMFLALEGYFDVFLENLKFISDEHYDQSRDGDKATDEDILEELRYLLLYEHLTVPILVEATAGEVKASNTALVNYSPLNRTFRGLEVLQRLPVQTRNPKGSEGQHPGNEDGREIFRRCRHLRRRPL